MDLLCFLRYCNFQCFLFAAASFKLSILCFLCLSLYFSMLFICCCAFLNEQFLGNLRIKPKALTPLPLHGSALHGSALHGSAPAAEHHHVHMAMVAPLCSALLLQAPLLPHRSLLFLLPHIFTMRAMYTLREWLVRPPNRFSS